MYNEDIVRSANKIIYISYFSYASRILNYMIIHRVLNFLRAAETCPNSKRKRVLKKRKVERERGRKWQGDGRRGAREKEVKVREGSRAGACNLQEWDMRDGEVENNEPATRCCCEQYFEI